MSRRPTHRLAAVSRRSASWLALAATAAALSACGNDDEGTIPPENAESLRTGLERVEAFREAGNCALLPGAAEEVQAQVNALPASVDREVKGALQQGAAQLVALADDSDQCTPSGTTGAQETTEAPPPVEAPPVEPPPEEEPAEEEPPADENRGGEGRGPSGEGQPGQDGGGNGSGGTGGGEGD
jgi:hypothetical protein